MNIIKVNVRIKQLLAAVLAVVLFIGAPLASYAAALKDSNYVIGDLGAARAELESLAKARAIVGAIYLKDSYVVKSEANPYSEDVAAIASGQTVNIIGVDVDEGRNIWYKIAYKYAGGTLNGYVEREFIASSDDRFLKWEDKYITTKNREDIRKNGDCTDIEQFPESYRDALYALRKTHPNWRFVRQNVNIQWKTAVEEEGKNERSLIGGNADSSFRGAPSKGTAGWYNATPGIIAHYMDPRNFLDEKYIFMFEQQSFNTAAHSEAAVQKILDGTFMSGKIPDASKTYAGTFVSIGAQYNMSPIALAARVRQEQGVNGTSPIISGTYPGYEGYYNYFNVKANGSTKELVYQNGLKYAKEKGWNTRTKSLSGGSEIVANNYVKRGQDSLYLQKFDVDASDGTLYTHQYMQNIMAPYSEAGTTYNSYQKANLLTNAFVFKIPVYLNMPAGKCIKPNASDVISLDVKEIKNLPVDQNAVVIPLINGGQSGNTRFTYTSSNTAVATVDDNGVITGIKPGTATISAKRAESATNTASCTVTVIKADINLSAVQIPEIKVVYSPTQKLKDITLPAGFSWINPELTPMIENEGYSVNYSPDNSRYNSVVMTIPVEVTKADIDINTVSIPQGLKIDAGSELATVVLPDGFVWADPETVAPKKTGMYSFDAYYCVDPVNYNVLTVQIPVEVVCESHIMGDWSGNHATCDKDGRLVRGCQRCDYEEVIEEPALGHSYVVTVIKEPTDNEAGIRRYTCTKCNDEYEEEIPALINKHKHEYSQTVTVEPGCISEGVMTYTCQCGDAYTEVIPALGHDYEENNICKRCGYELPVVPVHIHEFTLSGCTATCTEDGDNIYMCGCGETYKEHAEKLGHDMKDGRCKRCGYTQQEESEVEPSEEPAEESEEQGVVTDENNTATEESAVTPAPTPKAEVKKTEPTKAVPKPTGTVEQDEENETQEYVYREDNINEQEPVATEPVKMVDDGPIDILMVSSTVLNSEKIREYATDNNMKFRITLENHVVWDVDLTGVDIDSINADMGVSLNCRDINEESYAEVCKDKPAITMRLAHDGEFGFTPRIHVPVGEAYGGKVANLFYLNPDTGKAEFMEESVVAESGETAFTMTHASDYVIVIAESSLNAVSSTKSGGIGFPIIYVIIGAMALVIIAGLGAIVAVRPAKRGYDEDYYDEED